MGSKTLEKLIRERNRKLTQWLLAPVGASYVVLQIILFSLELTAVKQHMADWRDKHKDRIAQNLFLQNEADLREVFLEGSTSAQKESENLKVSLFNKNWKIRMSNQQDLRRTELGSYALGMAVDYRNGEVIDLSPLYLGDRLQGYLEVRSSYPWKRVKDQSLILFAVCVGVFLILRLGVWLMMRTLRKSIVGPLNWLASEMKPKLENLSSLKWVSMQQDELSQAPTEILNLVKKYNEILEQIVKLRQKENVYLVEKARVEIATQVAHDMRSPMAALFLAVESLPEMPRKQKDIFLSVMKRVGDISEELLKASQNDGNTGKVEPGGAMAEIVSVDPLIEGVVGEKKILLESLGNIELKSSGTSGLKLRGNDSDLRRALSNLIDNSIDALPSGGEIMIKVTAAQSKVYISVRDNGIGIAKPDFARVWDVGVSLGKPTGHGLGLAFVKKVVESWGGRVHLDSALGKGTTVSLELLRVE